MDRILILIVFIVLSCQNNEVNKKIIKKIKTKPKIISKIEEKRNYEKLNEKNAIPFLFEFSKKNKENKVRLETEYGNIDILLYKNTTIHRANFIFLTKEKYFDGTIFHRVVPNFIIQGGNSDNPNSMLKRSKIGKYLLPPDSRKGNKHHRGVISMPSSKIDNPHKLASPYD